MKQKQKQNKTKQNKTKQNKKKKPGFSILLWWHVNHRKNGRVTIGES